MHMEYSGVVDSDRTEIEQSIDQSTKSRVPSSSCQIGHMSHMYLDEVLTVVVHAGSFCWVYSTLVECT